MVRSILCLVLSLTISNLFGQNLGIGTSEPQAKLHIESNFNTNGLLLSSDFGSNVGFKLSGASVTHGRIGIDNTIPGSPDFRLQTYAGSNWPIKIFTPMASKPSWENQCRKMML